MPKLYSSRLSPLSEWVLVRKTSVESAIEIPVMEGNKVVGSTKKRMESSRAIVVAVGPGEYQSGVLVVPDPRLKPGVTVIANAQHFLQVTDIPEWKEEGLWQIPASMICHIEAPAGVQAKSPVLA